MQKGTFANIAMPTPEGGEDCMVQDWVAMAAQKALELRRAEEQRVKKERSAASKGSSRVTARCLSPVRSIRTTSLAVGGLVSRRVSLAFGLQRTTEVENPEASKESPLFPYRFYGQGSYFGELECISGQGRLSTVRCENVDVHGEVLILKKRDFSDLVDEFPQFGEAWASAAWRREALRLACLKTLTKKRTARHAAAAHIQKEFRTWRSKLEMSAFTGSCVNVNSENSGRARKANRTRGLSAVGMVLNRANALHHRIDVDRHHITFDGRKKDSSALILREIQAVNRRLDSLQAQLDESYQVTTV